MKKLIIAMVPVIGVISCQKPIEQPGITEEEVKGHYQVTSVTYKASSDASEVDYLPQFFPEACNRDDIFSFVGENLLIVSDNKNTCNPKSDQERHWRLIGNDFIMDDDQGQAQKWEIVSFDRESKLVMTRKGYDHPGDQLTMTFTSMHCGLTEANIIGEYQVTAVAYRPTANDAESDYLNTFLPDQCQRDDILSFEPNNVLNAFDRGIMCNPAHDDESMWKLVGNKIIMDDILEDGEQWDIISFDCGSKLVIAQKDFQEDGDRIRITLTRKP